MYLCGTQAMDLGTLLKYEWEIKYEMWKLENQSLDQGISLHQDCQRTKLNFLVSPGLF